MILPANNDTIIEENSVDVTKFVKREPKVIPPVEAAAESVKPVEKVPEEKD